jgi:TnpA family transposase
VSVPSLRASASYKYFGNGEGVSVYSGLDEAGQLVYTVVINAADRESSYVLDVVLHNQVIQPNAHSTDMHGVSEINFAVMGLLGIDFRPRLVKMHRQRLFSIDALTHYRQKDYKMVPVERIDYEHLVAYWDDVLRFNASMKLGYILPSMLLKRLNSYASEHPLHKALSDLGRLYKSDLVLRVVDDPTLRASIEGMLTKVEHSNKFGNAVMLGNGGDLVWSTERERNISGSCRMLIMNLINLFNLLYLSEKLRQCKTETDREDLLKTILKSSTHTWHHINLAGEYDFSDPMMFAPLFNLKALMNLPLPQNIRKGSTAK